MSRGTQLAFLHGQGHMYTVSTHFVRETVPTDDASDEAAAKILATQGLTQVLKAMSMQRLTSIQRPPNSSSMATSSILFGTKQ